MSHKLKLLNVNQKTGEEILQLFSLYGNVQTILLKRARNEGTITFKGKKSLNAVLENKARIEKEGELSKRGFKVLMLKQGSRCTRIDRIHPATSVLLSL